MVTIAKTVKTAAFKFNDNLLKSSLAQDVDVAKTEWEFFITEKCDEKKLCICQHRIKNVNYFFNKLNGNIICCGTTCCKKFNFEKIEMKNKVLHRILNLKKISSDDFLAIRNIQDYLEYARVELTRYMTREINSTSSEKSLIILYKNIFDIKVNYNIYFFEDFLQMIAEKLLPLIPAYIAREVRVYFDNIETLKDRLETIDIIKNLVIEEKNLEQIIIDVVAKYFSDCVKYYDGHTVPPLRDKIQKLINKKSPGYLIPIFTVKIIEIDEKIDYVRHQNFLFDKARYEARQEKARWAEIREEKRLLEIQRIRIARRKEEERQAKLREEEREEKVREYERKVKIRDERLAKLKEDERLAKPREDEIQEI